MLRVRWLGRTAYRDAHALQRALFARSSDDHLLLLEHPHVYTLGVRADRSNVLVDPASVGAEVVEVDRGGDVTYHGPGQLVGYPILTVPGVRGGGMADTAAYVHGVEQLVIDTLTALGLADVGRLREYPGVWVAPGSDRPRKIAAIGVRLSRGRSMHGFAINVAPDMGMFDHIVPCGISDKEVTSLAAEGIDVDMRTVVDTLVPLAVERWGHGPGSWERADVVWRERPEDLAPFSRGEAAPEAAAAETSVRLRGRLAEAGVTQAVSLRERKPEWMRAKVTPSPGYNRLRSTMRELDLVTVCEEAGCPNIYECWSDGTATFMINGERCTRACGFCLVDTRKPAPPDPDEPERVADAVARMGLDYAVVTTVARDDLDDGGAGQFAATIAAIRRRRPGTTIEVLISDCKGDPASLATIFDAGPDVLNHNVETVPRLQRVARPSASYARSLAVLSRAKDAGLTTKSGLVLGMGETTEEVHATLADLAAIGVDVVTAGQYLRPTAAHLPVARWWAPEELDDLAAVGRQLGLAHVEAAPLTRSSHHAKVAAAAAGLQVAPQRTG
ncbi:lipoyl synthase [Actinomarinicola tropica]|uniref:Multifunctional fusion protein n=1 Tax=Actinomarinicola tropica TaxID=2789776 RepID=A0A5Q2RJ91_9ACTN|nr:lipoyl synthase [Actinomarinicola tropica]QGG95873.1 lipoyl synthase [Actinomarinicola tropica]